MSQDVFDVFKSDSQSTLVQPISVEKFDLKAYEAYAQELDERAKIFWEAEQGVAVYRRFRADGVFAAASKDYELSLALQLGGLQASMEYKSDIPNFLEPWYGIGVVASAFGVNYIWNPNQAPAIQPPFSTVDEALAYPVIPIAETEIGRNVLAMTHYFLDKTAGRIPISLTDVQSPLNIASYLVDTNAFYMALYDEPELLKKLLSKIVHLAVEFYQKLVDLMGDTIAWPGHGFASSRVFKSFGFSDDVMVMLSPEMYVEFEVPFINRLTQPFGGAAFHSCGNWADRISAVQKIENLKFVDAAFSKQTDPDPNNPKVFGTHFSNSSTIINARMVGDIENVDRIMQKFFSEVNNNKKLRIIAVTYCQNPQEQSEVYNLLRSYS